MGMWPTRKPATQRVFRVLEDPDEPVALGTLHVVDAFDEDGLLHVVRAERLHGEEGERRVRRDDLAKLSCHSGGNAPCARRARPSPRRLRRAPDAPRRPLR